MADSTSPEPQAVVAPSALTSLTSLAPLASGRAPAAGTDLGSGTVLAAGADFAAGTDLAHDLAHGADGVVRPAPSRRPVPRHKPLPDAVAIGLVAVPDAAPPFDGARTTTRQHRAAGRDAADVSRAIAAVASLTRAPAGRPGQGQFAGHWPSQFAQVLAETLAGSRPLSQLAPWTTQQTRRRISQLSPLLSTPHRPRVKRVVVTSPAGGVLELAVIVGVGNRVRAVAVRLERAPASPATGPALADGSEPADGPDPARLADQPQPTDPHQPQQHQPELDQLRQPQSAQIQPQASIRQPGEAGQLPITRPPQTAPHGWICTAIEAA